MADKNEPTTREDAIKLGHETAKANAAAERKESGGPTAANIDDIVDDAHETARLNHEVDHENQEDAVQNGIPANDTSKKAKEATAKAQLDPNGDDPISPKEVKDSATDASMETGNKTAVSNEEAADRARNPGDAEEEAPRSTANPDMTDSQNATSEKVSEESTTNRDQAREGERTAGRPVINQADGNSENDDDSNDSKRSGNKS